jgi:hypothetical protein
MNSIKIQDAKCGDMIDESSLPASIVKEGGGWVKVQSATPAIVWHKYVCRGCHKDGSWGFKCTEIR